MATDGSQVLMPGLEASPPARWRDLLAVAILAAVAIGPSILARLDTYDAGLAASAGGFIRHGQLPYRDFWWLYGPLSGVVVGLATVVAGPSLLVVRLLGLLVVMAQVAFGYGILRTRIGHVPAALIALAAVGPAIVETHLDISAWSLSLACALAAIYVRVGTPSKPIWAGVLVGLALLARLDVGSYALLAILILPGRMPVLAGFLAVVLPTVAIAVLTTPISALFEQLIWYPLVGTRLYRSVSIPDLGDPVFFLIVLPVLVIPKVAILASMAWLMSHRPRPLAFIVLTAFAAFCQLQTLGRSDIYHHAQAAAPGFLLVGLWVPTLQGRLRGNRVDSLLGRSTNLTALVLVAAACASAAFTTTIGLVAIARGPLAGYEADLIAGVRTIAANTGPDEPIFVGLTSHRYTYSNPMLVYYLADRRSGVRVAMFNPGITNSDSVQEEMVDNLIESNTEILLLHEAFATHFDAASQGSIAGSTILDTFIAANYEEACVFGDVRILASRSRQGPVACEGPRDESLVDILGGIRE